jgi:hypothetical protein
MFRLPALRLVPECQDGIDPRPGTATNPALPPPVGAPDSFVPPKPIHELRDLMRYRRKLVETQAAERNRLL